MGQAFIFSPMAGKVLDVNQWFTKMEGRESSPARQGYYYSAVSSVFRAARLRANDLCRVPFKLYKDDKEIKVEGALASQWQTILWRTELSMSILGASYWLKTYQVGWKYGGLDWLSPTRMTPRIDSTQRIEGWDYLGIGDRANVFFGRDRVLYIYELNLDNEEMPGPSSGTVSHTAAGAAHNATLYMSRFFETGAIPAVVLTTDQNIPDAEVTRVETTWQRLFSGIKNAWRTAVLRMGLKPVVVGSPARDLSVADLKENMLIDVATGFGVPVAMLREGNAATKDQIVAYYNSTVIPECFLLQDQFNSGYWARESGLRMAFDYSQIEAIQQDEATKAIALVQLRNANIITSNEARGQMNLPPIAGGDKLDAPKPQLGAGGSTQTNEAQGERKPKATPMEPRGTPLNPEQQKEMRRWRNKAEARGKDVAFDTELLSEVWVKNVHLALAEGGLEVAFGFLKQREPAEEEASLRERIRAILDYWMPLCLAVLLSRQKPDLAGMYAQLRSTLTAELANVVIAELMRLVAEYGIELDIADVYLRISQSVRDRSESQTGHIRKTTEDILDDLLVWLLATPEATEDDIRARLVVLIFGEARADNIASTETTWALYWATLFYRLHMERVTGQKYEEFWETAKDERTCAECAPLHMKPKAVWSIVYPGGPPVHNRCRCRIRLMRKQNAT